MKTLLFAFAVACSSPPNDTPSPATPLHEPDGPVPHEASQHRPLEAPPTLDQATTCGRAQTCCRAFAAVTPNVVAASACAEPVEVAEHEDADERCERMIIGWRVALEHHVDVEPPPACAAP